VLLCVIGAIGFTLRAFEFPVAPVIIGLLLGPMAEQQLQRALAVGGDSAATLVTRPGSAILLGVASVVALWPAFKRVSRA
jgi:putative tricarboxylic transport membrane protein